MKRTLLIIAALATFLAAGPLLGQPRGEASGLGDIYIGKGFTIRPPAQWWLTDHRDNFLVKFSEVTYQAFLIVDVVPVTTEMRLDTDFINFVHEQNKEVKKTLPGFTVKANRMVRLGSVSAYRTEASFAAGPNQGMITIYYVAAPGKVFMIMTMCPDAAARKWDPVFLSSVNSFKVTE